MLRFDRLIERLDAASVRHCRATIDVYLGRDGQLRIVSTSGDGGAERELQSLCSAAAVTLRAAGVELPWINLGEEWNHWADQAAVLRWALPRVPMQPPDPFAATAPRDASGNIKPGWRTPQDNVFRAVAMALASLTAAGEPTGHGPAAGGLAGDDRGQRLATSSHGEQIDSATRAIALLVKMTNEGRRPSVRELAATVGCGKDALYRDQHFMAAWRAASGAKLVARDK